MLVNRRHSLHPFFHLCRLLRNLPAELRCVPQSLQPFVQNRNIRRFGIFPVQHPAFPKQFRNFGFRFFSQSRQLFPAVDAVFREEFHLLDPLIQPADILPYRKTHAPGLSRQRPHFVEIGEVQRTQAGEPAQRPFSFAEFSPADVLPSRQEGFGFQDAPPDGLRGVIFAQGLEPDGAFPSGGLQGEIFPCSRRAYPFCSSSRTNWFQVRETAMAALISCRIAVFQVGLPSRSASHWA